MKGIPEYKLEKTRAIAREVMRLTRTGLWTQADICRRLKISRGMCRYYAVKEHAGNVYKPMMSTDKTICGNDLQRRNTPADWQRYMEKNPHYAELYTNGKVISQVCKEIFDIRKRMWRGEASFFLEGLPDSDETDCSIGYGDR